MLQVNVKWKEVIIFLLSIISTSFFRHIFPNNNNNSIILFTQSFTITPPTSTNDYRELASLLVESFDEPTILRSNSNIYSNTTKNTSINATFYNYNKNCNDELNIKCITLQVPTIQQQLDEFTWLLYDKFLTEQYTFRQYVQNSKRMKGKKYALLLAKDYTYNPGVVKTIINDVNTPPIPFYETIGMIEIGMVLVEPTFTSISSTRTRTNININDNNNTNDNNQSNDTNCSNVLTARPTVGVLCVKTNHMNKGVGKALLNKCEQIVREIWNETQLFIEVEPSNERALRFFNSNGYDMCNDAFGNELINVANVSRRRKVEERPHFVLSKIL